MLFTKATDAILATKKATNQVTPVGLDGPWQDGLPKETCNTFKETGFCDDSYKQTPEEDHVASVVADITAVSDTIEKQAPGDHEVFVGLFNPTALGNRINIAAADNWNEGEDHPTAFALAGTMKRYCKYREKLSNFEKAARSVVCLLDAAYGTHLTSDEFEALLQGLLEDRELLAEHMDCPSLAKCANNKRAAAELLHRIDKTEQKRLLSRGIDEKTVGEKWGWEGIHDHAEKMCIHTLASEVEVPASTSSFSGHVSSVPDLHSGPGCGASFLAADPSGTARCAGPGI